jgi:hypothetical protein
MEQGMNPMNCRCMGLGEGWIVYAGIETLVLGLWVGYNIAKYKEWRRAVALRDAQFKWWIAGAFNRAIKSVRK